MQVKLLTTPMNTLALYSLKGGVGKTAAAVNLAHLAALHGQRVLLWDLDPQAAASWYFRARPTGSMKHIIRGKTPVGELVRPTRYERVDILPGDFSSRKLDILLHNSDKPEKALRRLIEPFSETYSLLVLDCPPSLSLTTDSVFNAANLVAIPLIPTPQILHVYRNTMKYIKKHDFKRLRIATFLSLVDRRRKLHNDLLSQLPHEIKTLLNTDIPYSSAVEKMSVERAPLTSFGLNTPAGRRYLELWLELENLLG